ncbi:MAG: Rpn family recombination-promoting nuclease/putative transposase [Lachnospiraceae bacterium]|nr:Rpn family recombination-promoting nuclease/putative transposase [Lachnospiraceae bacterium]
MKGNEAEQMNIETRQTSWEELSISNDFLFGKVMQNPELCKELLQRILPDLDIDHVEYPELQKTIKEDFDAKGVRLDAYVNDGKGTVYDIEMQAVTSKYLPKRTRYYQSMIDLQLVDKGQDYDTLNNSYIIFICLSDLFGKNRYMYTFENVCEEDSEVILNDGAKKVFLNADGKNGAVSEELKAFLDYVAGRPSEDIFVKKLKRAVEKAKKNREWRHEYMTLLMRDRENRKIGMEVGILGTVSSLRDFNIPDDEIFQKIQEKYNLSPEEAEHYMKIKAEA